MIRFHLKNIHLTVLTVLLSVFSHAQNLPVFGYDEYISLVKNHHPLAYRAKLKAQEGDFYVQKAKGGFDPKLYGNASQKYFDGKQYYSYLNGGLKIPTWFGITVNGGYNINDGTLLNSESFTSENGIWNLGVSANLGKGLFIDQRRADLKQAQIYANSTALEQRLMLNQLMLDASIAYFDWFKTYNQTTIYKEAVNNAEVRFNNTIQSCLFGDKPCIDTLKALIQLQDRSLKYEQAKLKLTNKKAQLETFLWQEGAIPLEIGDSLIPPSYQDFLNPEIIQPTIIDYNELVANHPDNLMSQNKIEATKIDYRLKKESLKPTLMLKYNALSSSTNTGIPDNYSIEDFTWGAKLVYPIFTLKERADVKLTGLKINQQEALLINKTASIRYKIEAAENSKKSLRKQVQLFNKTVSNYELIYQAETTLFNTGESSLFLVNIRDQNLIDAKIKLIDIIFENHFADTYFKYQTFSFN